LRRLTWTAAVTVCPPTHADNAPDRDFARVCAGAPRDLRRAAIHAASGAMRGYLSNLRRGDAADV